MPHCFVPASILLPRPEIPLGRWACVACDQFTSQPEYWQAARARSAGCPSALDLVLPECELGAPDIAGRIRGIQDAMRRYRNEVLTRRVEGFVYLERTLLDGSIRAGLLGAVDLEQYSYEKGSRPVVRPSENTVVERIPPRLAVRRGAALELPHVMMLVDDDERTVIEPVGAGKDALEKLYEGDLMLDGGHIAGWAVTDPAQIDRILAALDRLGSAAVFDCKYPDAAGQPPMTLAVGDGNHSLATAKAFWEELKPTLSAEERARHPARWCLAEVCNIHSPAIQIEPIHRVFFGAQAGAVRADLLNYAAARKLDPTPGVPGAQTVVLCEEGHTETLGFAHPAQPLAVGTVETFVEEFLAAHPGVTVDYIHGRDTAVDLVRQGATALLLPEFEKSDIFRGVVLGGVLPRKTFSMGHPQEKRYYLEARCIEKE